MRKLTKALLGSAVAAVMAATVAGQDNKKPELRTVGSVDLNRYTGKWYEIARYPN